MQLLNKLESNIIHDLYLVEPEEGPNDRDSRSSLGIYEWNLLVGIHLIVPLECYYGLESQLKLGIH